MLKRLTLLNSNERHYKRNIRIQRKREREKDKALEREKLERGKGEKEREYASIWMTDHCPYSAWQPARSKKDS